MKVFANPSDFYAAATWRMSKTTHLGRRTAETDFGVCDQALDRLLESNPRLEGAAELQDTECDGEGTLSRRCIYTWDPADLADHRAVCASLAGEQLSYKELKITCNAKHSQYHDGARTTDTNIWRNLPECLPKEDCSFENVCASYADYVAEHWAASYRDEGWYSVSCQATSDGCTTSYNSGLSGGIIAGIVSSVCFVLVVMTALACVCRRQKLANDADNAGSKASHAESTEAEGDNTTRSNDISNSLEDQSSAAVAAPRSQEIATPKAGIGFLRGWCRDGHRMHTCLWACNVVWLVVWIYFAHQGCEKSQYTDGCNWRSPGYFWIEMPGMVAFVWIVFFLLFLTEFYFSSTYKYLRDINTTESLLDYMARLYRTRPTLSMTMQCYHNETRTVSYTDAQGNVQTRTETYRVVTYIETENVNIISWEDQSRHLQNQDISEYQLTKVTITKTFDGDEDYEAQRNSLVDRNRFRDIFYTLIVNYNVAGYKDKILAAVDLEKIPAGLNLFWCCVAHLTMFMALPYRIWMSSVTGKIETNVHKSLKTQWSGRIGHADLPSIGQGQQEQAGNEAGTIDEQPQQPHSEEEASPTPASVPYRTEITV